jgi:hypothetical protein
MREGLKSPLGIHATKREPPGSGAAPAWVPDPRGAARAPTPSGHRQPPAGAASTLPLRAACDRPGSCPENLHTWPAPFGQDGGNRHVNFYLGAVGSKQLKGRSFPLGRSAEEDAP